MFQLCRLSLIILLFISGFARAETEQPAPQLAQSSEQSLEPSLEKQQPVRSYHPAQQLSDHELNERINKADVVALVEVRHINHLLMPGLSMPGMLAVQGYEYHFAPSRFWKGEAQAESPALKVLRVDMGSCHRRLHRGERYLIMAKQADKSDAGSNALQSYSCDDAVHLSVAQDRIAQIRRLNLDEVRIAASGYSATL